jgi:hypothetical protein
MKINNVLMAGAAVVFSFIVVGALLKRQFDDFNKDTPFEGFGAVGSLGNVTDKVSGGALSRFGSWLGETVTGFTDTRTLDELTETGAFTKPAVEPFDGTVFVPTGGE